MNANPVPQLTLTTCVNCSRCLGFMGSGNVQWGRNQALKHSYTLCHSPRGVSVRSCTVQFFFKCWLTLSLLNSLKRIWHHVYCGFYFLLTLIYCFSTKSQLNTRYPILINNNDKYRTSLFLKHLTRVSNTCDFVKYFYNWHHKYVLCINPALLQLTHWLA